jgi:hypothetical protein
MALAEADKLELLKLEYEKLTSEQRMYIQQYAPTLSVFGVTVLAGFAAALVNSSYQAIYPLIPFALFLIVYVGIGQSYMVAALGIRIRAIEETLAQMNGGSAVLEWEHLYAPILVFSPLVRLPLKEGRKAKGLLNPTFTIVLFMVLSGCILIGGSSYKSFLYIDSTSSSSSWAWGYIAVVASLFLGTVVQSFSFLRLGYYAPLVDIRRSPLDGASTAELGGIPQVSADQSALAEKSEP